MDKPIQSSSVHGKECIGCINHKRDVMIMLFTDPPEGSDSKIELSKFFLTTQQAIILRHAIDIVLRENNELKKKKDE